MVRINNDELNQLQKALRVKLRSIEILVNYEKHNYSLINTLLLL